MLDYAIKKQYARGIYNAIIASGILSMLHEGIELMMFPRGIVLQSLGK